MDRRELVKILPALMLSGKIEQLPAVKEVKTDDPLHIPDDSAVSAVRFNGKTYALGFQIPKNDSAKVTMLTSALNRCMERTIMEVARFR